MRRRSISRSAHPNRLDQHVAVAGAATVVQRIDAQSVDDGGVRAASANTRNFGTTQHVALNRSQRGVDRSQLVFYEQLVLQHHVFALGFSQLVAQVLVAVVVDFGLRRLCGGVDQFTGSRGLLFRQILRPSGVDDFCFFSVASGAEVLKTVADRSVVISERGSVSATVSEPTVAATAAGEYRDQNEEENRQKADSAPTVVFLIHDRILLFSPMISDEQASLAVRPVRLRGLVPQMKFVLESSR